MPKNRSTSSKQRRPRRERNVRIRGQLRRQPDLNRIAHTVIALAMAQAQVEKDAMASVEPIDEVEQ